jgi:hypothetical protein
MLGIGVVFLPLGALITILQLWLFHDGPFAALLDSAGESNAFVAALAFAVGIFFTIFGLTLVQAVTALAMVELDEGREVSPVAAYRLVLPMWRPLLWALVRAAVIVAILDLTVVGLFVGTWLLFRWILLPQTVVLERAPHPLHRSARLTRGHWWFVASITIVMTGGGLLLGPVIGSLLLFATTASFNVINLVAAIVYVFAMPLAAITQTYLYFHLRVEEQLAPAEAAPAAVLPAELAS